MEKGRRTCNVLKDIRQQIADANGITYAPRECHHEGPCAGTCPACEAEVRYLEQQLTMRRMLGKAVVLTGIAASMTSLTACGQNTLPKGCENDSTDVQLAGDVEVLPDGIMEMPEPEERIVRGKVPAPVDTITPIKNDKQVVLGEVEYSPAGFRGGEKALMKFIEDNVRYPKSESAVEGSVIVSFKIERDGTPTDFTVEKSLGDAFDKEALRVARMMPKWRPARMGGTATVSNYSLPVVFKKKK